MIQNHNRYIVQSYKLKNRVRKARCFSTLLYRGTWGNIFKEEFIMKFKGLSVILACVCCLSMPMQVNALKIHHSDSEFLRLS